MPKIKFFPSWPSIIAYLRDSKSDWKPKIFFILALLYLIFPFDVLPDIFPFIGWLDDLGLLSLAMVYILNASTRYKIKQENKKI
ncbi:MAG: DUF1232 domain-containing protein [Patescibacteria group bacterium]